jgi:hypothetical protein
MLRGAPRLAANEAGTFKGQNHLMDRRRGDAETVLDVGFGGRPQVDARVGVDEGETLSLVAPKGPRRRPRGHHHVEAIRKPWRPDPGPHRRHHLERKHDAGRGPPHHLPIGNNANLHRRAWPVRRRIRPDAHQCRRSPRHVQHHSPPEQRDRHPLIMRCQRQPAGRAWPCYGGYPC